MVLLFLKMVLPMRPQKIIALFVLLGISLSLISLNLTSIKAEESKPVVVTTTSVLASIVKDLASDYVDVQYIVSPSICPGHYDVKPSDIELIRDASLILAHGMEWHGWLRELINTANQTGDLHVPIYNVTGPWNTPPALSSMYSKVASILESTLGIDLETRLSKCLEAINAVDEELSEIAKENGFNGTPVVVMQWQSAFVSYLGFKVVASYGPPEFLSSSDILEIEENATKYGAKLIIDNLHSGVSVGEKIASDVGAVHVVLINFPDVVPGINNVTEMMIYNAHELANGLHTYEVMKDVAKLKQEAETWRSISIGLGLLVVIEAVIIAFMVKKRE